jgi:hypothetical protein
MRSLGPPRLTATAPAIGFATEEPSEVGSPDDHSVAVGLIRS